MKQHITEQQYNELSANQKSAYYNLLFTSIEKDQNGVETRKIHSQDYLPDIGEMIEFLGDNLFEIRRVAYSFTLEVVTTDLLCYQNKELCDSLWGAVKQKLEKYK